MSPHFRQAMQLDGAYSPSTSSSSSSSTKKSHITENTDIHGGLTFVPYCSELMPYSISHSGNQPLPIVDGENVYNAGIPYNCLGSLSASPARCDSQFSSSLHLPCQSTPKGICLPKSSREFSNKMVSFSNPNAIIKKSDSENKDEGSMSCSQTTSSYGSIQTLEKIVFPENSFHEKRSNFDVCREKLKGSVSQGAYLYFKYPSTGENWFSLTSKTPIVREGKNEKKGADVWIKPLQQMSLDVERLRNRLEQLEKRHSELHILFQQKRKYGNSAVERNHVDDNNNNNNNNAYDNKCVAKPCMDKVNTINTNTNINRSTFSDGHDFSCLSSSLLSSPSSCSSSFYYVEILANPTVSKTSFEEAPIERDREFKYHFFTLGTK